MTQDEIIRMAREAGYQEGRPMARIERFAALVRADLLKELAELTKKNGNTILAEQLRNYK